MCPNIRFALMDAEITDLTSSGAAEMVVGPVVFENFVLDHPGRWVWLMCEVFAHHHIQILHDAQGPSGPSCYVWTLQCLSRPSTSTKKETMLFHNNLFNRLNLINAEANENCVPFLPISNLCSLEVCYKILWNTKLHWTSSGKVGTG